MYKLKRYKLIICFNKELIIKYNIIIGKILKEFPKYLLPKMTTLQFVSNVPYVRFLNLTSEEFKELVDWIKDCPYKDLFFVVFYLFK